EAAALVVRSLEPKRIEHLQLVAILQIDAAVAAGLATRLGNERRAELDVQREILEVLLAASAGQQQIALDQLAAYPRRRIRAVEQHLGARRRLRAQRGALAIDLGQ